MCRLLGDLLNSPVGPVFDNDVPIASEGHDRTGGYYIGHGHQLPGDRTDRRTIEDTNNVVLMWRDPRDVSVSAMYHWNISCIHNAIYCVATGEWPVTHGGGFNSFYEKWSDRDVHLTRYEDLIEDTQGVMASVLDSMGIEYDHKEINAVVDRQSLEARRAWTEEHGDDLVYGKEFQLKFLRKGVVGDWQNHFDDLAGRMAKDYFNV